MKSRSMNVARLNYVTDLVFGHAAVGQRLLQRDHLGHRLRPRARRRQRLLQHRRRPQHLRRQRPVLQSRQQRRGKRLLDGKSSKMVEELVNLKFPPNFSNWAEVSTCSNQKYTESVRSRPLSPPSSMAASISFIPRTLPPPSTALSFL